MTGMLEAASLQARSALDQAIEAWRPTVRVADVGRIVSIADGCVRIEGLPRVGYGEVLSLGQRAQALVLGIGPVGVDAALLDGTRALRPGARVTRKGHAPTIAVGDALLGRAVDPLGRPRDGAPLSGRLDSMPLERPAPGIAERGQVHRPLLTGVLAIDAMFPIGRGQRELILGNEGTGKTSLVLDAMLRQASTDVICVYVAVGRRRVETRRVIEALRRGGGRWVVVSTPDDDPPGLRFLAPYAGSAVAEWFAERGEHVLIVYDDLTAHAVAWRELSLLLGRPAGREAYPGDVFYLHSRLMERAMQLSTERGGGSITALPIATLESGRLSAFIPTNLISMTDGQVVLSQPLFAAGHKPAIDAGLSVSRVGGRAQPPAIRALASQLRLDYASFLELEGFARLGTRLEPATLRRVEVGRRIRALLRAPRSAPQDVFEQVVRLALASESEVLLRLDAESLPVRIVEIVSRARDRFASMPAQLERDKTLGERDRNAIVAFLREVVEG